MKNPNLPKIFAVAGFAILFIGAINGAMLIYNYRHDQMHVLPWYYDMSWLHTLCFGFLLFMAALFEGAFDRPSPAGNELSTNAS